jgi:hypothetical protein
MYYYIIQLDIDVETPPARSAAQVPTKMGNVTERERRDANAKVSDP